MDRVELLRQKVAHLLQQFDQGQMEPSTESLEAYQITQEQFREGLLLLKADADVKKQQLEAQVLMDASDREEAKDRMGIAAVVAHWSLFWGKRLYVLALWEKAFPSIFGLFLYPKNREGAEG